MSDQLAGLIARAKTQVDLGKCTGSHTGNPHNIYQIVEELLAALTDKGKLPPLPTEKFPDINYRPHGE